MEFSSLLQVARSAYFMWIAIFGTAMLALSYVFDGHDHEIGHDVDHDHDHDHGGSHNMSILSLKVLWMFLVGFGVGGFFAANSGSSVLAASLGGLFTGCLMGLLGYSLMNYLYKRQGNSVVVTANLIGAFGVVDTAILPGQTGQVRCVVNGSAEYFAAQSNIGSPIPTGARVTVVQTIGSLLIVQPETTN